MDKAEKIDHWREVLKQQALSGLSAAAFCREHNVSKDRFYWWKRRFRREETLIKESGFLQLVPLPNHQQSGIRIRLSNNVSIEVERGFDPATLREVIQTVR